MTTPELSREQIEQIAETLRSFATAYPESIFTPFTPEETEEHSLTITRASGAMGRHCAQFMTEGANAIEQLALRALKAESSHAKTLEQIEREAFRFVDLSPDEQSNRNGEYVPAELARKLLLRTLAAEAELRQLALRHNVNQEPCKCWHCGTAVPAFQGSIVGPSCAECHRQFTQRPSDD